MNFKEALNAHVHWKVKLKMYAANPDKSLDRVIVGADNKCLLGQWLDGEGKKFASFPEYNALKGQHAKFHQCAAEVLRMIDAGDKQAALVELNTGVYAKTSDLVVFRLIELQKKAEGPGIKT